MFSRKSLLALLALTTVFLVPTHTSIAGDPCISGITSGDWVLPTRAQDGYATGLFSTATSTRPIYYFVAGLSEFPSPDPRSRYGEIGGVLYDLTSTSEMPSHYIYGEWYGSSAQGNYVAGIFDIRTGEILGLMQGVYAMTATGTAGRHRGEFYLCDPQ